SNVIILEIWFPNGTPAARAALLADVSRLDANNRFRLVDIPDVLLPQGAGYRIGALFLNGFRDLQAILATGFSTDPVISFVTNRFISNGIPAPTLPTESFPSVNPAFFGPSFEFRRVNAV